MAYRFTNTEKWQDAWFSHLKQMEMLLFIYLCDNCDIAGFAELNYKRWANDLNSTVSTIEGACKGLARGLVYSKSNDCIYIRNFLKHQKNYPLNPANKAHLGILKRFELYSYKFDFHDINEFIEGASKGLGSPIGIGSGIGSGTEEGGAGETKTWRNDFETYKKQLRIAYESILTPEYIKERENYHNGLDIVKTIQKSCVDFWAKEAGWKNKKASKTNEIDWTATFNNALTQKLNQVWKPRSYEHQNEAPQMKPKKLA